MEKWTIDYYLDDTYNLDSNVEIWVVRKGAKSFETNSQADAEWLRNILNENDSWETIYKLLNGV